MIVCIVIFLSLNFRNKNICNFKKIFYFFYKYWEIVDRRGVEYSGLQVTIATSFIFYVRRVEWIENSWDVEELKYLCLALDNSHADLNPNNFVCCQAAYLDEFKNYYKQNNG